MSKMPGSKKPGVNFTEKFIAAVPLHDSNAKTNQTLYWDADLKGFGLAVGKTSKTYIVQRVVRGSGNSPRRIRLGRVQDLTLKDARAKANTIIGELALGIDRVLLKQQEHRQAMDLAEREKVTSMTLRQVLDDYLLAAKEAGTPLRASTERCYRGTIARNLAEYIDKPVHMITENVVMKLRGEIKDRCKAAKKDASKVDELTGNGEANITFRVMKILFNHIIGHHAKLGITVNPFIGKSKSSRPLPLHDRTRYLEPSEIPAFLKAVIVLTDAVQRDYILFTLFTGFRRNEAAGLRWSEIDFNRNAITLPASRAKNKKDFVIPMSDFVRDLLIHRQNLGRDSSDFVFPANSASKHIAEPRYGLDRACADAGITRTLTIHDLRRTYINYAEMSEIPVYTLKALINHSATDVTGKHYTGAIRGDIERLRPYAQKVANKIKELAMIEDPTGVNVVKIAQA